MCTELMTAKIPNNKSELISIVIIWEFGQISVSQAFYVKINIWSYGSLIYGSYKAAKDSPICPAWRASPSVLVWRWCF